jgi:kumamolisin
MGQQENYAQLDATLHAHPKDHMQIRKLTGGEIKVSLILRRKDKSMLKDMEYFHSTAFAERTHFTRKDFETNLGASPDDIARVQAFAKEAGLKLLKSNASSRSVELSGSAETLNKAFHIELQEYKSPRGTYHSHEGAASVPDSLKDIVELIVGLDNRKVNARHFAGDPTNTSPLTPQQVAGLYNFPQGTGSGQTIGIYEMVTGDGAPGFNMNDVIATLKEFGIANPNPNVQAVAVDDQNNTNQSDGETLLDITVCAAIAPQAQLAVYLTGGTNQSIIDCLQQMIHPDTGQPAPNIVSISYGWTADDQTDGLSDAEYQQISSLFQDAAHLGITVLVSSGDQGAKYESATLAQTSYPATDPWVTACGGTTIGNIQNSEFTEYVWNDSWDGGSGATGGGISARFAVPQYQAGLSLPQGLNNPSFMGRGIPDLSGNASPVSGYPQSINGSDGDEGGTSAVAPLFAGLIALMNSNLGSSLGFINPQLYALADNCFQEVQGPPGPANNSYGGVTGYPATGDRWNACTGLGRVNGEALQTGLKQTANASPKEMMAAEV